ncbi:MAG: hypothetical protein ACXWP1_06610, partial [Bdellovibrionota bacterium]
MLTQVIALSLVLVGSQAHAATPLYSAENLPASLFGALGPAGPLGAFGPLGALGPVGDNSWNPSNFLSAIGDWS